MFKQRSLFKSLWVFIYLITIVIDILYGKYIKRVKPMLDFCSELYGIDLDGLYSKSYHLADAYIFYDNFPVFVAVARIPIEIAYNHNVEGATAKDELVCSRIRDIISDFPKNDYPYIMSKEILDISLGDRDRWLSISDVSDIRITIRYVVLLAYKNYLYFIACRDYYYLCRICCLCSN